MNYEKLMLEIFSRVKELEEKVESLEEKLESLKLDNKNEDEEDNSKITRSISREYVINKLGENNSNLIVDKANRAMGSGIVIKDKDTNKTLKFKFNHSKSHNKAVASGWHTVNEEELINNDIDGFIFNLEYKKDFYTFIFTTSELKEYVKNKEKDMNNNYHFYFKVQNGMAVDFRDDEVDVLKYLSRWNLISEMI